MRKMMNDTMNGNTGKKRIFAGMKALLFAGAVGLSLTNSMFGGATEAWANVLEADAASKMLDNTSPEWSEIGTFLSEFDGYLGYVLQAREGFAYEDDAVKTGMLIYDHSWVLMGDSLSKAAEVINPLMAQYFTSGSFLLKEKVGDFPSNTTELFAVENGQVIYRGGDWGGTYPKGQVREISFVDSDYIVTYDVYYEDYETEMLGEMMGTYTIRLKKEGDSYKFDDIKNNFQE